MDVQSKSSILPGYLVVILQLCQRAAQECENKCRLDYLNTRRMVGPQIRGSNCILFGVSPVKDSQTAKVPALFTHFTEKRAKSRIDGT